MDKSKKKAKRERIAAELAECALGKEALGESVEMFRSMATAAFDAVIMIDCKGRIVFWNPAAERIFGYTAAEVEGCEMIELIAPEYLREGHRRGMADPSFTERGEGPIIGRISELEALRKDGTVFPWSSRSRA